MNLFRQLSILAAMACLVVSTFAQGDPKALLKEINDFRNQKMTEVRTSGRQLDQATFNNIQAETKAKAVAATKDLDIAKIADKDAFDWAQVFSVAERHTDVCALSHKFLRSKPTPEQRYAAQILMMQSCNELGEAPMLAITLADIKAPNGTAAVGLARTAAMYSGTISSKMGVEAALTTLSQVEKGMIYENPQTIANRNLDAQLQRNIANPKAKAMTSEALAKLKETLLTSATTQNDTTRSTFATARAELLITANRKDEAIRTLNAFIGTLEEKSPARRNVGMMKTRLTLPGSPAPALDIQKNYGGVKSLAELKGKVVIVDMFAHWCGPCIASFPDMRKMYDELKGKGLEIVGVTTWYGYYKTERPLDKDAEFTRMADFMKEHNMNWPVVYGERSNFESYGVSGIPTVYIIDRDGNVKDLHVGYSKESFAKFRKEVEDLLK